MKLLRYIVNTILFVVIWCISTSPFVLYSLSVNGTRPSGIAGAGAIIAIFISYALVKKINKSNLWASLFEENQELNNEERFINPMNSFLQASSLSIFEITLLLVITFSLVGIYIFSYENEYTIAIICSTPLLIIAYLIKKRYFKANKNNKSSNIKEEVINEVKKDKS
jgi:hypothetical protein